MGLLIFVKTNLITHLFLFSMHKTKNSTHEAPDSKDKKTRLPDLGRILAGVFSTGSFQLFLDGLDKILNISDGCT
jgi:hypothetical protein